MHGLVPGQLGVEGHPGHRARAHADHAPAPLGVDKHRAGLDAVAEADDLGRTDEGRGHARRAAAGRRPGQLRLGGVDLGAEGVAAHGDVEESQDLLASGRVPDLGGEQDQTRAGAQHRKSLAHGGDQRLAQPEDARQPVDRGRLPAGQHQAVQPLEVTGPAHQAHRGAQLLQELGVLGDAALQGEHTDGRRGLRATHQPRSARRCGAGRSATLMPTMASPRPRETSAMTSGSS